jgi:hypothetical protein
LNGFEVERKKTTKRLERTHLACNECVAKRSEAKCRVTRIKIFDYFQS